MKVKIKGPGIRISGSVGGTLDQKLRFIAELTGAAAPEPPPQATTVDVAIRELDRHFAGKGKRKR